MDGHYLSSREQARESAELLLIVWQKRGADVSINAFHEESAREVADEITALGRKSLGIAADVTKKEGVAQVVKETLDTFGKIDILVNNFGAHTESFYTGSSPRFIDQDISEWDDDYEFNLKSQVLMCNVNCVLPG